MHMSKSHMIDIAKHSLHRVSEVSLGQGHSVSYRTTFASTFDLCWKILNLMLWIVRSEVLLNKSTGLDQKIKVHIYYYMPQGLIGVFPFLLSGGEENSCRRRQNSSAGIYATKDSWNRRLYIWSNCIYSIQRGDSFCYFGSWKVTIGCCSCINIFRQFLLLMEMWLGW